MVENKEKELKIRGAPAGETPKSPFARRLSEKENKPKAAAPDAPHNAVEEALEHGHEEKKDHGLLHHPTHAHKVAIITGASSGIGKAVALHLASSNYNLVLVSRKRQGLHEVEQELAKYNIKALVRECDVTKVVQVHETVQHTIKEFGHIDVLVNCAGIGIYGNLEEMRLEDINNQMLTNYFGTVLFIKECLPKLKETKGNIINVASMVGLIGMPNLAAYSASKHAVVGLSESLRYEVERDGVAVSCICPGKVRTNFFQHQSFESVAWAHDDSGINPSAVATVVQRAIKERKLIYTVPARHKIELLIGRLLPESWVKHRIKRG